MDENTRDYKFGVDRIIADVLNPGDANGDECLDASVLAMAADGTLLEGDRSRFEDHVVRCVECRGALAFALRDEFVPAPPEPKRSSIGTGAGRGIAIAVVVSAILAIVVRIGCSNADTPIRYGTESSVSAAIDAALAEFGWRFEILDEARLRAIENDRLRSDGGARVLPTGEIFDPRPNPRLFGRRPSPGAALCVIDIEGREIYRWTFQDPDASLRWPDDLPGARPGQTLFFHFTDQTPLGPIEVNSAARVVDDPVAARRALEAIAKLAPRDEVDLWTAQTLLRRDMPSEALVYAERAVRQRPKSSVAQETLAAIQRVLLIR